MFEVILLILLLFILAILINFKRSATTSLDILRNEINELKKQKTIADQTHREEVTTRTETKPAPERKVQWESGFKRIDEPEIVKPKPVGAASKETTPAESLSTEKTLSSTPVPAFSKKQTHTRRPSFFERNPDLEKFIGENLVSKIGIGVLVLAIGFFVKFAIDNNWIGPVGRVAVGILCGGILVFLAHRLRTNYKAFSSVLVGGGLAVFYFTITLAYHQFHLFSQTAAFVIMIVITIFAVALSLLYDRQELAIIALVGGFSSPFLVSDGAGNYKTLFSYLLLLNTGLLVIAYRKSWRLLNLLAFVFTAILFAGWLESLPYDAESNIYAHGLAFAALFYLLFFFVNIANNVREGNKFTAQDFSILLLNTALFFAAGMYCLYMMKQTNYQGLFTIALAVFNLIASFVLFRKREIDKNLLYLFIGITLTFISLTAPIQLDGNYITMFWASEAVLLFWLFQKSGIKIIRLSSVIVWVAMILSLVIDWAKIYAFSYNQIPIVVNKGFITGVYAAVATYLLFVLRKRAGVVTPSKNKLLTSINIYRISGILLIFFAGLIEINYQFSSRFPAYNLELLFSQLYLFAFVLTILFVNKRIASISIPLSFQFVLLIACIVIFLLSLGAVTLLQHDLLRDNNTRQYFAACWIAAFLLGVIFFQLIQLVRFQFKAEQKDNPLFAWLLCGAILVFLSFETFWMTNQIFYSDKTSLEKITRIFVKTCLPILWGICSFVFMWLGMNYKYKPLRIISLGLFLIILVKLFLFDISNIPAAGKIAAFFSLGVLLLIVSFMYQKLKNMIIQDDKSKSE